MIIEISELDKEQREALLKIGQLLEDLSKDLKTAGNDGKLPQDTVWAIRNTMDVMDIVFDELSPENQTLFEFLQDGPTSKMTKV